MKILFTSLILAGALLGTVTGTDCTQNNDCTEEGFVCNKGSCECGDGYFRSGISECSEVATIYGSTCSNDFHCRLLNNSRCDFEGNCRCLPGFVFMTTHCIKVLGTGCSEIDCSLLVNSVCGDKNNCECEEGFSENNNVCSDQNCQDVISILPNLPERFSSFNMSLGDPLISDHLLEEGWYRTEDHYMPTIDSGATINSFGTYYPIVVSGSDPDYYVNLTEDDKSLVAVVVGNTYSSEEIEIKVRGCPDGFHYYLKPPKTRPAAYGFLSNHDGRIARKIDESSTSLVVPHLRFYQEETEKGIMDKPFAVWQCGFERDKINSYAIMGTIWYVNDRLIQTKGPIIQRVTEEDLNVYKVSELELTEFELMASGGSIGSMVFYILYNDCFWRVDDTNCSNYTYMTLKSKLRCDIAYKGPDMYEEYVLVRISSSYRLEFLANMHLALYEDNTQYEPYISANFGLGCSTLVSSEETHCYIKMKIKPPDDPSVCYLDENTETGDPTTCDIVIPVWTKFGLEQTGSTRCDRLPTAMTINGLTFHESYHLLVMLQQVNDVAGVLRTKMRIQKTEFIGQQLFDNYKVPPLEVTILPSAVWVTSPYYSIVLQHGYITTYTSMSKSIYGIRMSFPQEGTYLLLRTTTHIFQVHVEVRFCDMLDMCVCGVHIQYRQDIYMYHMCGGLLIDGFVYGNGESIYLNKHSNGFSAEFKHIDGTSLLRPTNEPYMDVNNYGHSLELLFVSGGKESYEGMGIMPEILLGRDGKQYHNSIGDFLKTWRLSDDESLFNPENYREYRIIDKYVECGCPRSTVNISNPVVTSESDTYITRTVYTGAIHCQLDHICSDIIEGEVWKPSLLPNYVIKDAYVTTELLDFQVRSPALVFRCVFHTVDGYKYIIVWFVNDVLLKESDPLPTDTAKNFTLIDEEIFNSNEVDFFLDMKVQCSANVLDYQENVLAAPVLSQAFYPLQVVSDEIVLIRGLTAVISVNVNIKLCSNTSADCGLDIQIVDASETHTCADSTIAMLGESGCGTSISGLSMSPSSSNRIVAKSTITTKNNNKYRLKTFFDLKVKAVWRGVGHSTSIWNGYLKDTAKVTVEDTNSWQGQSCYSHVDPHFRTLDGRYFDIHLIEEFVMLRHTKLPIEIQTVVIPCYTSGRGWNPHCSCAVTVRAGSDVFTINHCDGQHVTGFLSAKDNVLRVYSRNVMFYQIRFPTGMLVNVYVIPWGNYVLNIDIYPTPADVDSIVGLCGTFNGDTGDDFMMRNGLITNDPVQFGLSWGLNNTDKVSAESLRLKKNYENPSHWKRETKLCVCQDPNSLLGGAICSANEEDSCSSPIKHKGNQLLSNTRTKRDTKRVNFDFDNRMSFKIQDTYKPDERVKRSMDNALSLDTAREMCEKAFTNCSLSLIEGTPVNPVQNIEECALDTAVTGTLEWFSTHCEAFGLSLEEELDKDVEYTEKNPEIAVYTSQVLDCSGCSGNGDCVNGTCHCDPGFGSDICLVNLSRIIEVTYIFRDGYCDISVDGSCQDFIVESDGFVPEFSARVNVKMASKDGYFRDKEIHAGETTYLSFNEGIISISGIEDKTATSANDTVLAQQFGISVSNNGVDFGNPKYVTVYNSRCQEINYSSDDTIVVILKNATCFIDGTCYIEDERSPSNDCLVCKSLAGSNFDWTTDCDSSVTDNPFATSDPSVPEDTSVTGNSSATSDPVVTGDPSASEDPSTTTVDSSATDDTSATSDPSATDDTSATNDPSVIGDGFSVYVIVLIVLGSLFLIGATAVVSMMRRSCSSKPAAPHPSVTGPYTQQPRIYYIEDDNGREDGLNRETYVRRNRLPRYVLD